MSRPHDPTSCQGLQPRIEALVDGELESAEKASLEEHLETCPGCARQVHLALGIRRELRALPELDSPSHVLEAALQHSRDRESRRRSWSRLWHAPRPTWIALGAAAAALLSVLILLPSQEPTVPVQSAEVVRATEEARLALAYLEKLTHRAAKDLREDVVQKHLVEPAARGLARSLKNQETEVPTGGPISDYHLSYDTTRSS